MIPWEIKAREFVSCNCAFGCPCQFNALPTYGTCEAVAGFDIIEGYFGKTRLDGLRAVGVLSWPGPIHEGHGRAFIIIDERAEPAQRDALLKIIGGEETEPGATMWNVYASTLEEVFEPAFKQIDIEVDVQSRTGRIVVDGLVDVHGEPIRNPVTGDVHRARIDIPNGFEYALAEMGSTTATTNGPIALQYDNRYGQFVDLHLCNTGIVRKNAA